MPTTKTRTKPAAPALDSPDRPDPPAKASPATRTRQFLTSRGAEKLVAIARAAAEIRDLKSPGERGTKFHALAKKSKMRHETLLKWGRLYQAFKKRLGRLLIELGKTRLYVLAYAKEPRVALRDGVPDRKDPTRTVELRNVSAEEFRRHISAQHQQRQEQQRVDKEKHEPRARHWFRIDRRRKQKEQARAVVAAVDRTIDWLEQDVARVLHRIREGISAAELKHIRKLRQELRTHASSITAELKARSPRPKKRSAS